MASESEQSGDGRRPHIDVAGAALVILSALAYSSLGIFGKIALDAGAPLGSLMATRFVLAAAILWTATALSPGWRAAPSGGRAPRAGLLLWGGFGLAGQSALFFGALRFTSASLAEVLLYTCPAFLALIEWGRTGRRPQRPVLVALALALVGTWLAAAPDLRGTSGTGVALGLLAGVWYAAFLLALDRVSGRGHPAASTTWVMSGAACAWTLALLGTGYEPPRGAAVWGAVAGMVLAPTLLGFTLFVVGMRRVGPQIAAILSTFEPLGTLALAALLLGERLRPGQWLGAGLILAAAFALAALPRTVPPPATH